MRMGTKSLLFGAHQFLWHPFTVALAWKELYGPPTWKELVCIFLHDVGYWGCPNMEGPEGERHPVAGAIIAERFLDARNPRATPYRDLCMYHSRTHATRCGYIPSKLCWADKLCVKYDPWWLYLPRVWLSGEFKEYRAMAESAELLSPETSDRECYGWARERMIRKAYEQDARPPYQVGS